MKNTIKKKNARRTANIIRDRVFITTDYTAIPDRTVFVYPVVGYNANGTTVTRFTVYSDRLISKNTIAAYVVENMYHKVLNHVNTISIHSHMIMKDWDTHRPNFTYSTVNPWVYKYNKYNVDELNLISW